MPGLTWNKPKGKEQKAKTFPIAIVKGDNKTYHNKFLYLDTRERIPPGEKKMVETEIPYDCMFSIIPNPDKDKRDVFYIAGASGSGKSWIARQIANNYKRMYPDRPVFVVSKLTEDETLDGMEEPPIRLDYTKWVESPPNINQLSNSLIIFDDYDTIEGKPGKAVQSVINDLAIMGRKHTDDQGNVSMLLLTHYLTNYSKTRLLLNEATHYVVYPQNSSAHALAYLLKTYMGLDKSEIKKLRKLGRWVCFRKNFPQVLLSAQYAKVLHQETGSDDEEDDDPKNLRVLKSPPKKKGRGKARAKRGFDL